MHDHSANLSQFQACLFVLLALFCALICSECIPFFEALLCGVKEIPFLMDCKRILMWINGIVYFTSLWASGLYRVKEVRGRSLLQGAYSRILDSSARKENWNGGMKTQGGKIAKERKKWKWISFHTYETFNMCKTFSVGIWEQWQSSGNSWVVL